MHLYLIQLLIRYSINRSVALQRLSTYTNTVLQKMYSASVGNYYAPIIAEDNASSHRTNTSNSSRYATRIMVRRYALTSTAYKYLEIGISMRPIALVEIVLGDNRGNQLVLSIPTWKGLIEKRADIEQRMRSSGSWINDLAVEFCVMYNSRIVKMMRHNKSLYFKPDTLICLFNLEHCINHVYMQLYETTHHVDTKFSNL